MAVFTAAVLVVVLVSAAFAVDLGMQRVVRSDMQGLADLVALDAARLLDGRTAKQIVDGDDSHPSLADAVSATFDRNKDTLGTPDPPTAKLVMTATDPATGGVLFQRDAADTEVPDAVMATASGSVKFAFGGITGVGSGGASRDAIAEATSGACFSLGSYAARLKTGESPILGPLLGAINSNLQLSAVDYTGLANAQVGLLDLLGAKVGVGTFEELLKGDELVSLGDYYLALASAVKKGSGQTAQVTLLETIAAKVGGLKIPLGSVLNLGTGGAEAGLDASLNLLDLVAAGAFVANGSNAIAIPQLKVDLGPILGVQATAHVIQKPQIGCGRAGHATASTAQIRVDLAATALNLKLGLLDTHVKLSGYVEVASAKGSLTEVRCGPPGITVSVGDGVATVHLTLDVKVDALFGIISAVKAPVLIDGQSHSSGIAELDLSDGDYSKSAHVGDGDSGLPWLTVDTSQLTVLSLPLGSITDLVVGPLLEIVVNPLLQALDKSLLTPLLHSLGLSLAGADVYAMPTPQCATPRLVS